VGAEPKLNARHNPVKQQMKYLKYVIKTAGRNLFFAGLFLLLMDLKATTKTERS